MNVSMRLLKLSVVVAALALVAVMWGRQGLTPAQAAYGDSDGDTVIDVAEVITQSNPNDPNSTPEDTGGQFISGQPLCHDGVDNDLDGLTDEDDTGCLDSDNTIISDAMEQFLGADPNDPANSPEDWRLDITTEYYGFPLNTCGNLADDDQDGLQDGNDPGCAHTQSDSDAFDDAVEKRFGSDPTNANSVPEHEAANPGSCSDSIDNDLDGATDDADPACGVPANDDRANATVIGGLPYTSGPTILKNATLESDEPSSSCGLGSGPGVGTVWYSYTPAQAGVLVADTSGSRIDLVLAVWKQDGAGLEEVDCGYTFSPVETARIAFNADAGATYLFQVQGFPGSVSVPEYVFNLSTGHPPANDSLSNAAVIGSIPFTGSSDISDATTQFGEPRSGCGEPHSTAWYKYTPPADALLLADTDGSDHGLVLDVWTDSKFGLVPIDCAYGYDTGTEIINARLALKVDGGRTYYFRLATDAPFPAGNAVLNITSGTRPLNDDFANGSIASSLPFEEDVDLLTATTQPGESQEGCDYYGLQPRGTVWYRYTSASDRYVKLEAEPGANVFPFVAVFDGSGLDDLRTIACSASGSGPSSYPQIGFKAEAGVQYYIQVANASYYYDYSEGGAAGVQEEAPANGFVRVEMSELVVPNCADEEFFLEDPAGDTTYPRPIPPPPLTSPDFPTPPPGPEAHDITSVSGGGDAENYCLTVNLARPIDPPSEDSDKTLNAYIDFDLDQNSNTGFFGRVDFACGQPTDLGVEMSVGLFGSGGVLVPLYSDILPEPPLPDAPDALTGFVLYGERSFTLIVPNEALVGPADPGPPDEFNFAVAVLNPRAGPSDCAPNGGYIHSPTPATLGDADCNGTVDARDTTVVLQLVAGLIPTVPCPWVADVNDSGVIGPVDAALILQYGAGMLPSFPAAGH